MTAMKDAMHKAGVDTASSELYTRAVEALRAHNGSAVKAAPKFAELLRKRDDLLLAVARNVLLRAAADMQIPLPGTIDISTSRSSRRKEHQRHRPRTDAERTAAMQVMAMQNEALRSVFDRRRIGGRPMGELAWGELDGVIQASERNAVELLRLGTTEVENILIAAQCRGYAQVADHSTKIGEVITASQGLLFEDEARRRAPELIAQGMARYREVLESYRPQIAAT